MKLFFVSLFILVMLFSSSIVFAEGTGIWQNTECAVGSETGGPIKPCNFCDALIVMKNIINFMMEIAIPISIAVIVYGAFRLLLAGGNEKNVADGKNAVTKAVWGVAITLASWVIVNTVLHILTGNPNFPWAQITC